MHLFHNTYIINQKQSLKHPADYVKVSWLTTYIETDKTNGERM